MKIRYGQDKDLDWLLKHDDISAKQVHKCIERKFYIVAEDRGQSVGFLRCNMFWHKIPFMEMIRILEERRGQGIGTKLLEFWEKEVEGSKILMTSAMTNEPQAIAWHKRNGFFETGELTFGAFQSTPEVFLVKNLVSS